VNSKTGAGYENSGFQDESSAQRDDTASKNRQQQQSDAEKRSSSSSSSRRCRIIALVVVLVILLCLVVIAVILVVIFGQPTLCYRAKCSVARTARYCHDKFNFYRAIHFSANARSWDRMSSVCLSVCPSVCNVGDL